jgi:hypothetical protein
MSLILSLGRSMGVIDREGSALVRVAGVRGTAGECRGPFGKLRAGSSARKERGPQDDQRGGASSQPLLLSAPKNLSIGKNYTIEPKSLTAMEI